MNIVDQQQIIRQLRKPTLGHFAAVRSKLDKGLENVVIAVFGDSTGVGNGQSGTQTRWPFLLAQKLAVTYPAYTVNWRPWNGTNNNYDTTVVVQTGTGTGNSGGPFVLDIYNGSASGQAPSYSQGWLNTICPVTPDLAIINHGHNLPAVADGTTIQSFYGLARDIAQKLNPSAPIVCMSQNPRTSPATNNSVHLQRMTRLQELCATEGYGFVNVAQKFFENSSWATALMNSDGIHPNDAGSLAWFTLIWDLWQKAGAYANPVAVRPVADRAVIKPSELTPTLIISGSPGPAGALNNFLATMPYGKVAGTIGASFFAFVPPGWRYFNIWTYWTTADGVAGNVVWQINRAYEQRIGFDNSSGTNTGALTPSNGSGVVCAAPTVAYAQAHSLIEQKVQFVPSTSPLLGPREVHLQVARAAGNASDTYAGTAHLYGVVLERAG